MDLQQATSIMLIILEVVLILVLGLLYGIIRVIGHHTRTHPEAVQAIYDHVFMPIVSSIWHMTTLPPPPKAMPVPLEVGLPR